MKRCGRCSRDLPLDAFHAFRDGRQSWCKTCKREYSAAYYDRNRQARQEYNRAQRQAAVEWFRGLKEGRPCSDCGGVFHPVAMQWDHPPGVEKIADVAFLYRGSRARVLREIEKCELVCANCHAIRTFMRRQAGGDHDDDRDADVFSDRGPRSSAG